MPERLHYGRIAARAYAFWQWASPDNWQRQHMDRSTVSKPEGTTSGMVAARGHSACARAGIAAGYVVRDANGQALVYVYSRDNVSKNPRAAGMIGTTPRR